jgi:hypothetical protein
MVRSALLYLILIAMASDARAGSPIRFVDVASQAGVAFRHINGFTEKRHMIETMLFWIMMATDIWISTV